MARKPSKTEWHQENGLWCRTIGNRGTKVRLFERTKGGVYYRALWIPGRGIDRRSLETRDRREAERLGRELLGALLRHEELETAGVLPLADLWERYSTECIAFLDNDARTRKEAAAHADVLVGFFGIDCNVCRLTEQDQLAFTQKRLVGGIARADGSLTGTVRTRSVEVELQLLHTMLRWATTVRSHGGRRLLEHNPLAGVKRPREKNPKRPVATWERYQQTLAKVRELANASFTLRDGLTPEQMKATEHRRETSRRKWLKLELALILAEATGRRLGSIRQLQWSDVDFKANTIRWRAETDKKGREWIVPAPAQLMADLRSFRLRLGGAFGGLMFPTYSDSSKPMTRDSFGHWLREAEELADLPKLDGSLWHAYRRAWATARKSLPVKDVAHAGGWSDTSTLISCYQQADDETLLEVMSFSKKITERAQNA